MAVRMSVVWAVRLSFVVAFVALQAFADSGDPLFVDSFSGPSAAPFSWTPISAGSCFRTLDADANPVMQCDSNGSIVVSGGGSATSTGHRDSMPVEGLAHPITRTRGPGLITQRVDLPARNYSPSPPSPYRPGRGVAR